MSSELPSVPKTVHFVGSIPLTSATEVFTTLSNALGRNLRRIPDGETGQRGSFIIWQKEVFTDYPAVLRETIISPPKADGSEVDVSHMVLKPLEYDDFALSSYAEFRKLRAQGIIPPGVRFQVCLPTPINIICNLIEPAYRAKIEPIYEQAMMTLLKRIQDNIPSEDLAIQFDCPSEFAFLEGVATVPVDWFSPVKEGLIERVVRVASVVQLGVELGFHLCYGDFGHKHFVEPKDTRLLVDFAKSSAEALPRSINWIHVPVPQARIDAQYFEALRELRLGETELYLGLIHADDEEGTKRRIEVARSFVSEFGIATECGLGRGSPEELESVLDIASRVLQSSSG